MLPNMHATPQPESHDVTKIILILTLDSGIFMYVDGMKYHRHD